MNVFFAISDADERGQFGRRAKRLSAEAAEWSGWNLWLEGARWPRPVEWFFGGKEQQNFSALLKMLRARLT